MSRRKFLKTLSVVFLLAGFIMIAACNSNKPEEIVDYTGIEGTTLVIYSTLSADFAAPIIQMFEERYGVDVEITFADTGATLARLRYEADDPQADIMWGGGLSSVLPEVGLFEDFLSVNEPYMMPGQENAQGNITRFIKSARVLMVNTDILGDIEIRGYACLLNPALRGQIAIADPAAFASSFNHLVNQLFAMGANNNPHHGWDYVEQFIINVNGIMLPDSTAVHHAVANGEFIVGLISEEAIFPHIEAGAPIKAVYIEEGIVANSVTVAIVNGTRNRAAAEAFIDFVTSHEVQSYIEANLFRRTARADIISSGALIANAELNWIPTDTAYILYHRDAWLDQFMDLWMKHN